jgi:hypothetical protein
MPKNNYLKRGQTGHTYVKRDYGKYTLYKLHEGEKKYRKVMDSTDYEDIRPHRHDNHRKTEFKPKEPIPLAEYREKAKGKHKETYAKRAKPKKEIKTQTATLAASDKALQKIPRTTGLVIAEQTRPQKVRVQVNSKTSIMVYPNEVENAITRFNKRYKQSQEQSHNHQRKPVPKVKTKQVQSDLIFYN